uniref:DNA damage-inducible transcript 4-like protein isoform X2 n=1 Tax=Myxine glutinosa TaxID=7769 RepID=UPI00358E6123
MAVCAAVWGRVGRGGSATTKKTAPVRRFTLDKHLRLNNVDSIVPLGVSGSPTDADWWCLHNSLEDEETAASGSLVILLRQALFHAKRPLCCDLLLVPEHLLEQAACRAMRAAAGEPCGIWGAILLVTLDGKSQGSRKEADTSPLLLARLPLDPSVAPTFELTLLLHNDGPSAWTWWYHIMALGGCFTRAAQFPKSLRLSPSFRLFKRKLYCQDPAEEC